ncbi:LemA family [Chlamydia abortus]|nr:LemA family [Chlamydia abortus]SGA31639.1 LemA family [Chlamydia abortus]
MNASSTIQAAQAKRYATLTKMLNVVLGYAQHEKSTLTEVTKMRQQLAALSNETDTAKLSSGLEAIKAGLNIQLERYPELKADRLYLQLSSEISLQEDEIYAAIRIYNQKVTAFNSEIYNFPIVYVVEKLQLHNMALFEASEKERADVDMSALVK